jgi:hypothetical protein
VLIPTIAFALVALALYNAILENRQVIPVFMTYLATLVIIMVLFTMRVKLLLLLHKACTTFRCLPRRCTDLMGRRVANIRRESSVVYFSKTANICRLNKAMNYIKKNEDANHCRVVHVYEDEKDIPRQLLQCCKVLDCIYPSLKIDVVFVRGNFGAPIINHLCSQWKVPANLMFITCPASDRTGKRIQDLHGVRVIMSHEEENFSADASLSVTSDLERVISEDDRPLSLLVEKNMARIRIVSEDHSPPASRPPSMRSIPASMSRSIADSRHASQDIVDASQISIPMLEDTSGA